MSLKEFVSEYLHNDDTVQRYQSLLKYTRNFVAFIYISGAVLLLLFYSGLAALIEAGIIDTTLDDREISIIVLVSILISIAVYRILLNRRSDYELNPNLVFYHYIARSIKEYNESSNMYETRKSLIEAADFIGDSKRNILHPERESEFLEYVSLLKELDENNLKEVLSDTFEQNAQLIVSDIRQLESRESLILPNSASKEEPSEMRIIFEELIKSSSDTERELATIGIVFIFAIIAGFIVGLPGFTTVVTVYPLLQAVVGIVGGEKDSNS